MAWTESTQKPLEHLIQIYFSGNENILETEMNEFIGKYSTRTSKLVNKYDTIEVEM